MKGCFVPNSWKIPESKPSFCPAFTVQTNENQLVSLLSRLSGEVEEVLSREQLLLLICCNTSRALAWWKWTHTATFSPCHTLQCRRKQRVLCVQGLKWRRSQFCCSFCVSVLCWSDTRCLSWLCVSALGSPSAPHRPPATQRQPVLEWASKLINERRTLVNNRRKSWSCGRYWELCARVWHPVKANEKAKPSWQNLQNILKLLCLFLKINHYSQPNSISKGIEKFDWKGVPRHRHQLSCTSEKMTVNGETKLCLP